MNYKGILLILGGCGQCETSAKRDLRRVQKLYPRDYGIKYIAEVKKDPDLQKIFQRHPELGQFTSAFLYNPKAGLYLNLKGIDMTQEVRQNINDLFGA